MDPAEKETLEILDEQGHKTGKVKIRNDIHREGDFHATIHLWIIDEHRQLLLQKRAPHKKVHPGKWDISVAGHIPAGMSATTAAVREAAEELGLRVAPKDLVFTGKVLSCQYHETGTSAFWDREFHSIYLLCIPHRPVESFSFPDGEVTALRWIPLGDFFEQARRKETEIAPHPEAFAKMEEWFRLNLPGASGTEKPPGS